MASYTVVGSTHKTLAASVVDIVTLDADYAAVEIINRDPTSDLYVTVDGAAQTAPTVLGDSTFYVGPKTARVVDQGYASTVGHLPTTVRLISAAAIAYSVTGVSSVEQ